ncbi:MAG TPA: hypothetical protein VNG90_05460 [Candidatus Acidoferrum sp.]|nr:hypothetical protein [Candidatus Acidoferrum sp.]
MSKISIPIETLVLDPAVVLGRHKPITCSYLQACVALAYVTVCKDNERYGCWAPLPINDVLQAGRAIMLTTPDNRALSPVSLINTVKPGSNAAEVVSLVAEDALYLFMRNALTALISREIFVTSPGRLIEAQEGLLPWLA